MTHELGKPSAIADASGHAIGGSIPIQLEADRFRCCRVNDDICYAANETTRKGGTSVTDLQLAAECTAAGCGERKRAGVIQANVIGREEQAIVSALGWLGLYWRCESTAERQQDEINELHWSGS